ncbi:MAG: JAB domain-containing protein [Sphingomicrobium sp.]
MFHQRAESPLRLNGLEAARRFFAGCLAETDPLREHLWVAHVDDQARCLHLTRHDGDGGGSTLPLREVIADAAVHGSAGLILAHNHPSGDPTPSPADRALTKRLVLIGEAMDVAVLDHLVMAGGQCSSMRAMGLL